MTLHYSSPNKHPSTEHLDDNPDGAEVKISDIISGNTDNSGLHPNIYETITSISNFYAPKRNEKDFIYKTKTIAQWEQYKKDTDKFNKSVYMEYYTQLTLLKAFFDIDIIVEKDKTNKYIKDLDDNIRCSCKSLLEAEYTNKDIIILYRPVRLKKHEGIWKKKISYRMIVNNTITNILNLKEVIKKLKAQNSYLAEYWDEKVYRDGTNKLCMLNGIKPFDSKTDDPNDKPKPFVFLDDDDIKKFNIFDTAITYIKPDYTKYLNTLTPSTTASAVEPVKTSNVLINLNKEEIREIINESAGDYMYRMTDKFYKQIEAHIIALSHNRASDYNDWFLIICIICNLSKRYHWNRDEIDSIVHQFSMRCPSKYNESETNKKIESALLSAGVQKVGLKTLYDMLKIDNIDYYKKNVSLTYYEIRDEFEKEICLIMNPTCFYRSPSLKISRIITQNTVYTDVAHMITPVNLQIIKSNVFYNLPVIKEKNGKQYVEYKKTSFLKTWNEDPERKQYEGVRFSPGGLSEEESKIYKNVFNGFAGDHIELIINTDYSRIQPILDHIKLVLASNHEESYQYILKWYSRIIQDPKNKPCVGLVFYSDEEGTGKNSFSKFFCERILGRDITLSAHNMNHIFGKFNSVLSKCLLLVIEEASGDLKKFMESLKTMITESTFVIEKKNIDSGQCENWLNIIFNTNNKDILNINDTDRRFVIFQVYEGFKNNEAYFNKLHACMNDDQNIALFMKYLREEVKCDWNTSAFQKNRPLTEAYKKQKQLAVKNYMKFFSMITSDEGMLFSINEHNITPWKKYNGKITICIKKSIVYEQYKLICMKYGYVNLFPYDKFFERLKDKNSGIKEVISHKVPSLKIEKTKIIKWLEIVNYKGENEVEIYNSANEHSDDGEEDDDNDTNDDTKSTITENSEATTENSIMENIKADSAEARSALAEAGVDPTLNPIKKQNNTRQEANESDDDDSGSLDPDDPSKHRKLSAKQIEIRANSGAKKKAIKEPEISDIEKAEARSALAEIEKRKAEGANAFKLQRLKESGLPFDPITLTLIRSNPKPLSANDIL